MDACFAELKSVQIIFTLDAQMVPVLAEGALQEVRLSFMASPSCSDTCILRRPPHGSHAGFWAPKVSKSQDDFWWGEQVGCAAPFYPDTVTPTDAAWRHVVLMMGLGHSHHPRM